MKQKQKIIKMNKVIKRRCIICSKIFKVRINSKGGGKNIRRAGIRGQNTHTCSKCCSFVYENLKRKLHNRYYQQGIRLGKQEARAQFMKMLNKLRRDINIKIKKVHIFHQGRLDFLIVEVNKVLERLSSRLQEEK